MEQLLEEAGLTLEHAGRVTRSKLRPRKSRWPSDNDQRERVWWRSPRATDQRLLQCRLGRVRRLPVGPAARLSRVQQESFDRGAGPAVRRCLTIVGLGGLAGGLLEALGSVDALAGVLSPALLALWGALSLWVVVFKRREKHTFGFNPDLYLAVARPVSEGNERPEVLVHRHS